MTNKTDKKITKRVARHNRVRSRVVGTASKPRLAVFRSNRFMYAQLIDDAAEKTLAASDSRDGKGKTATDRAVEVGTDIAAKAKKAGIETVVFDRGGFRYQGAVAALADAAREGGLTF